jgi:uncharacterized protein with PIN domain
VKTSGLKPRKKIVLFRICHRCQKHHSAEKELDRCPQCSKPLMPQGYFHKIHDPHQRFEDLYSKAQELQEAELLKGLCVLWEEDSVS